MLGCSECHRYARLIKSLRDIRDELPEDDKAAEAIQSAELILWGEWQRHDREMAAGKATT